MQLIATLQDSIALNTFVRLTLSKNRVKNADLKKIIIRLAIIKQTTQLSFVYRHTTRDITKNLVIEEGIQKIQTLLEKEFLIANLFTIEQDWSLELNNQGKIKLRKSKPTFKKIPTRSHDKTKVSLLQNTQYLVELEILTKQGQIKKDRGSKLKQINKFIEIIDGLLRQTPSLYQNHTLKIFDMGAGKGYLTFALYDYLINTLKSKAIIKGIEVRTDLIAKCNRIAQKVGFEYLTFEEGFISDFSIATADILIALHACDTATDDAIFKGIQANAKLIICAPCCHKQIRKQIRSSADLQPILDYGILKERQAEMITDVIRALLLEAAGYKTKVFEFISTEHTGKNVMIIGQKHQREVDKNLIFEKLRKLKAAFGIEVHYLENLLGLQKSC